MTPEMAKRLKLGDDIFVSTEDLPFTCDGVGMSGEIYRIREDDQGQYFSICFEDGQVYTSFRPEHINL